MPCITIITGGIVQTASAGTRGQYPRARIGTGQINDQKNTGKVARTLSLFFLLTQAMAAAICVYLIVVVWEKIGEL
jgi:hypothetical protein